MSNTITDVAISPLRHEQRRGAVAVINRSVLFLAVGLLAVNAVIFVAAAWTLTRFPYELDYGEGIVLWQADHVVRLADAYHSISDYPYIVFHYPPVYHLLSQAAKAVFHDPLVSGRMVSWLAGLGVALLVGLITRMGIPSNRGRLLGPIIAALLVFQLPNIDWVPYMRVDITSIFFSLLGLFIFFRFPNRWGYVAAAVAFVIAVFTKQTMIAAPAAAALTLVLTKRVREAVLMVTVSTGLGLVGVAVLSVATHGQFLMHVIRYNVNPFNMRQLLTLMQSNFSGLNGLEALAWALPLALLNGRRFSLESDTRNHPPTVRVTTIAYFLGAFVFTLAAGKTGAYKNYFLEWNVVSCILAGFLYGGVVSTRWYKSVTATAMILIMGSLAVGRWHETETLHYLHVLRGNDEALERFRIEDKHILDLVQQTPAPVLSDNITFLMLAGKEVPWEPAIVTQLANRGIWNEAPALEMIKNHRFGLIILKYWDTPVFYTATMLQTIRDNYVEAGLNTARYKILVPK